MAIFLTLSVPLLMGLLGMVVDLGWLYWRREACLTAAQAGAIAAAAYVTKNVSLPLSSCSTSTPAWCSATATSCSTSPPTSPSSSFDAACEYVKANGFTTSNTNQTVQMTAASSTGTSAYTATVTVGENYNLTFLAALGLGSFTTIKAAATAGANGSSSSSGSNAACVYVLDPTGTNSLNATNDAQIRSSCGVYVNSNATSAMLVQGSANITTTGSPQPPIEVYGGTTINNGGSTSPGVTKMASQVSDPLASLVTPWCTSSTGCTSTCQYTGCTTASGSCDHTNVNLSSYQSTPYTLNPGVYCGTGGNAAISVSNGNGVIFNPGMYVINGGGVSIQSSKGSSQPDSGTGVIFYMTGTASTYGGFQVANGVYLNLTAPTTGDLADVLVYEDRSFTPTGSSAESSFQGGSGSAMSGIIYLPKSTINLANGTNTSTSPSLVVYDAIFAGGAYVFAMDTNGTLQSTSTSYVPKLIGFNTNWGKSYPIVNHYSPARMLLATHLPQPGRRTH